MSQPCKNEILLDNSPISTISTTDKDSSTSAECAHEPETLWIGDIPLTATTAELKTLLLPYGNITNIQLKRSTDYEKFPLNYAFVKFEERGSASNAFVHLTNHPELAKLTVHDICCSVRIGWAKTNSTLHIGNLDCNVSVDTLAEIFSRYGELASCNGEVTGIVIHKSAASIGYLNGCYATVTFTSREAAEEARLDSNGMFINKKQIKVDWNKKKKNGTEISVHNELQRYPSHSSANVSRDMTWQLPGQHRDSGAHEVISIYVQFEAVDDQANRVNEAFLKRLFAPFGSLTGCYIKARHHVEETGGERGYAFVHFDNTYSGQTCARTAAAVIGTHGNFLYEGVIIKSEVSKNFCRATGPAEGGLCYPPMMMSLPHMMMSVQVPLPEDTAQLTNCDFAAIGGDELNYPTNADSHRYVYVNDNRFSSPYFVDPVRIGDMGGIVYMGVDQNAGCRYPGGQYYLPFYGEPGVMPLASFPTHPVHYPSNRR